MRPGQYLSTLCSATYIRTSHTVAEAPQIFIQDDNVIPELLFPKYATVNVAGGISIAEPSY
jgi:hypothetical protein